MSSIFKRSIYYTGVTSGKIHSTLWLMVVGITPAVIMSSLYSRVMFNLWFKKTNEFVQIAVRRSRKKVTKVALLVSVIYVISWFPQLVVYLLSNYETGIKFGELAYMASVVMVTFNSAVNPLIYALQSGRFRQHFKELLCRHQRRRRGFPLEYCDAALSCRYRAPSQRTKARDSGRKNQFSQGYF